MIDDNNKLFFFGMAGRKLKCNGNKIRCKNCFDRGFECKYPTTQKRRGPGKGPGRLKAGQKGSRSRKRGTGQGTEQESSSSGVGGSSGAALQAATDRSQYELESLAPEVRQFTSILNPLYDFEPPAESPRYPSTQQQNRTLGGGEGSSWTRRSWETSAKERSEAEEVNRDAR